MPMKLVDSLLLIEQLKNCASSQEVGAAFAGGVILGFGEAAWSAIFSVDSRDLAVYSLLAILFIFRPNGLFGRRPDTPSLN